MKMFLAGTILAAVSLFYIYNLALVKAFGALEISEPREWVLWIELAIFSILVAFGFYLFIDAIRRAKRGQKPRKSKH
jgi:hypothetical protein